MYKVVLMYSKRENRHQNSCCKITGFTRLQPKLFFSESVYELWTPYHQTTNEALFVLYEDMGEIWFFMFGKQKMVCLQLFFVQPNSSLSLVWTNATQVNDCVSGYFCWCCSNLVTFICNCSSLLRKLFFPKIILLRKYINRCSENTILFILPFSVPQSTEVCHF